MAVCLTKPVMGETLHLKWQLKVTSHLLVCLIVQRHAYIPGMCISAVILVIYTSTWHLYNTDWASGHPPRNTYNPVFYTCIASIAKLWLSGFHATLVCTHAIQQQWWNESIYKWFASVPMKQTVCMLHSHTAGSQFKYYFTLSVVNNVEFASPVTSYLSECRRCPWPGTGPLVQNTSQAT